MDFKGDGEKGERESIGREEADQTFIHAVLVHNISSGWGVKIVNSI
jgi:hypothetical protein